jgi:nicotinamide-nucleotide amidase
VNPCIPGVRTDTTQKRWNVTVSKTPEPRVLRLYRVPDPDPTGTIGFLNRELEPRGVTFDAADQGDGEVVVTVRGAGPDAWSRVRDVFRRRHGSELFSTDGATVDEIVAARLDGHRVATAESLTAGLLLARLTDRSGSSAYVVAGVGAYSVEAKISLVRVPRRVITRYGVVSPQTAESMATGILDVESLRLDTAIALTGVAGPSGGTEAAPVGTVCLSVATSDPGGVTLTYRVNLPGDRSQVRRRSVTLAMHMLRAVHGPERLRVDRPIEP